MPPGELTSLLARAAAAGITVAVHSIGDAALKAVLGAVADSGATGTLEHVQQVGPGDPERIAQLGLAASVQPLHLLQDRDAAPRAWPGRDEDTYAFRRLADAGVQLLFGSDAPVAEIEPWQAMAAAVERCEPGDRRGPWTPSQRLSATEALAASVAGAGSLTPGMRGDVVLLDRDPLGAATPEQAAARLRAVGVLATVIGGEVAFRRQ